MSRPRWIFLLLAAVLFALAARQMQWLTAPPLRDEVHYWPTAQLLTADGFPSLSRLHDYPELCTPLSLILSGLTARITGWGIAGARLATLLAVYATLVLFVATARARDSRVIPAAVGLLSFPYFVGVGVHVYPDSFAVLFTLAGLIASLRRQPWLGALAFALAISCRQYMVAFPAGLALWELSQIISRDRVEPRRMFRDAFLSVQCWASLAAMLVLAAWIMFWGGFGPPAEVARQAVSTARGLRIFPQYALYSLACIGLYFVTVHWALFMRSFDPRPLLTPRSLILLCPVILAFAAFPPLGNIDYEPRTMGYFDVALRWLLEHAAASSPGTHDLVRVIIFGFFAWLAMVRFSRWSLPAALLLVHLVLLTKAHIAWDKYQLPMLACLWYLIADFNPAEVQAESAGVRSRARAIPTHAS